MITTSFLILKYALSKTGIIIIDPKDYQKIEFGQPDSNFDITPFEHEWDGTGKAQLRLYSNSYTTLYHNNGPKSLEFVPNTPLGRGLALNYITYLEEKKLASMAKQLILEGQPFQFPWGVGVTKAQDAKRFIITAGNRTIAPESQD